MIPYTWTRLGEGWENEQCPPDLTFSYDYPSSRVCKAPHNAGYVCTRRVDHGGRHAAGTGDRIVAVWP